MNYCSVIMKLLSNYCTVWWIFTDIYCISFLCCEFMIFIGTIWLDKIELYITNELDLLLTKLAMTTPWNTTCHKMLLNIYNIFVYSFTFRILYWGIITICRHERIRSKGKQRNRTQDLLILVRHSYHLSHQTPWWQRSVELAKTKI